MTREDLRQKQISNDDAMMNTRILWNHMSAEQQAFVVCGRALLANPTPAEIGVVNAFLDALAARLTAAGQ